jgi:hypothetical protein
MRGDPGADERMPQGVALEERVFMGQFMIRIGTLTRSWQTHVVEGSGRFVTCPPRRPENDRWE